VLDLFFQCPKSGSVIASGIRTDNASIQRVAQLPVSVFCPWCKQTHRMRVCDGQLIETQESATIPKMRKVSSLKRAAAKPFLRSEIRETEAALEAKVHR
jgi:hypothetical protein